MECTIEDFDGNNMLTESSEFSEPTSCVTKPEYQGSNNPSKVTKSQAIFWNWKKELKLNNADNFCPKVRINLENIFDHDKIDLTQKTNDEAVFSSNEINVLNSNFIILHSLKTPINFTLLSCLTELFIPPHDLEYVSNFYSIRKIDSPFHNLEFKNSSISELYKLFPGIEDIFMKRFSQKIDESNLNLSSSSANELNLFGKENFLYSICSGFKNVSKISNIKNRSENSFCVARSFKLNSVKSDDYLVDLIKIYKNVCFPMKRCKNTFKKPKETSSNRIYNVFTKNRQFSASALHLNYNRSKRLYFAKDSIHVNADDRLPFNIIEEGDEYCSGIQDNFIQKSDIQELSTMQVSSKIVKIRQRVENLMRGIDCELDRREQHHLRFIENCKRICDSTVSFDDYDELYNIKSLQNKFSDEKGSLSDDESSLDNSRNQSVSLRLATEILNASKGLVQKYSSCLEKTFRNFPYQVAVILGSISLPFVALLFQK